jgi:hypothetical protein
MLKKILLATTLALSFAVSFDIGSDPSDPGICAVRPELCELGDG